MKLNKKIFSFVTAVLMLSCLIVSCTKKENEEKVSDQTAKIEQEKQTGLKNNLSEMEEKYGLNLQSAQLNSFYKQQKYQDAVDYYEKLENPDIESKLIIAVIYYITQDYKKSATLFRELAEQDIILAKYYMALFYFYGTGGIKQDYKKSFDLFKYCADKGNIPAKKELSGSFYFRGLGGKKDLKKSFDLSKEMADDGNMYAKSTLISYYIAGIGTETSYQKALEVFESMGEYADKDQINKIADMYYSGMEGIQRNPKKAVELYTKAAAKGSTYAKCVLSTIYVSDVEIEHDYKKSFELASDANDKDFFKAKEVLAVHYCIGKAVKQDLNKAIELFTELGNKKYNKDQNILEFLLNIVDTENNELDLTKINEITKLAQEGNAEAQIQLSVSYYYGLGNKQDYKEAFKWCKKSADNGNIVAQQTLFNLLFYGIGTEKNYQQALEILQKLAQAGNADAQTYLANCYLYGILGLERNYEKCVEWYKKAAEQGNAEAQYGLANLYYSDIGVKQDYKQALYWYKKAAEQDRPDAQYMMCVLYYYGLGTKQDYKEAFTWCHKAAKQGNDKAQIMFSYGKKYVGNSDDNWLMKSAEQGNSDAQFMLGWIQKNLHKYEEALEWFKKSAYQGNLRSQYEAGKLYKMCTDNMRHSTGKGFIIPGIDLETAREEAYKWFEVAASQGEERSLFELGVGYLLPQQQGGLGQDYQKSAEYMEKAVVNGDIDAIINTLQKEKLKKSSR